VAEIIIVEGQQYKKRSPFGAWLLIFPTLLIYLFVWYYKAHDEARRYLKDDNIKPGLMTFSLIIPIWNYYTMYKLGEHIGRMQERAGLPVTTQPILGLIAGIVASLHIVYYQSELNKVWDAHQQGALPGAQASAVPAPPPPPPPPPEAPRG
jgi:uncharacterized protein DUF4234